MFYHLYDAQRCSWKVGKQTASVSSLVASGASNSLLWIPPHVVQRVCAWLATNHSYLTRSTVRGRRVFIFASNNQHAPSNRAQIAHYTQLTFCSQWSQCIWSKFHNGLPQGDRFFYTKKVWTSVQGLTCYIRFFQHITPESWESWICDLKKLPRGG